MRKIKDILIDNGFRFNHNLGQNFITDKNLLDKIVELSGVDENDVVVEIGTGAGTLTRAIAEKAKKVYSFEVDRALKPVLDETLSGLDNVEVIFKDVLKMKDKELIEIVGEKFKVVENIPYYITTALVMRFLEESVHPSAITVMVQKEVADRFVAKPATEDYGAITMAISLYGDAKIVGQVDKSMFYPVPKVDSSIVRIDVYDKYAGVNKKNVNKAIKCAFMMRRKTLLNNLTAVYPVEKDEAEKILESLNIDLKARGETLTLDQIIEISELLSK